jgi:hypothetical protein
MWFVEGRGGAWRVLLGRLEVKRRLGRPRRRLEDSSKMYLQEMEWGGMDWI